MGGRDATAEALYKLLFGRTTVGYCVVGVKRTSGGSKPTWDRHGIDVQDPGMWVLAVETAVTHALSMELWPFACGPRVLKNIGTSAFDPSRGSTLRAWQSTVVVVWDGKPTDDAMGRWVNVGGHAIATAKETFGLLPLEEARPLGALTHLAREVASVMGAQALGYCRALPLPGVAGATFMTDVAQALVQEPATGDDLVRAGLRKSVFGDVA